MELSDILHNLKIQELTPMQELLRKPINQLKYLVISFAHRFRVTTAGFSPPLGTDLESGYTRCAGSCTSTFTRIGFADRNCVQVHGNSFQSYECYGGRPAMEEHRTMKGIHPTVIIGTPGRMSDHLRKENFNAATVVTLVIDEFDKCLEFGFMTRWRRLSEQLPSLKSVCFSRPPMQRKYRNLPE